MIAGFAGIYYGVLPIPHLSESTQINELMVTPFWWRLISVIRAAFGEELIFRGLASNEAVKFSEACASQVHFPG